MPTPTFIPWDRGGSQSRPCPSISHVWENWCPAPEAGRDDCAACMASPDMMLPSARPSTAASSPAPMRSGSFRASRSGPWTSDHT